MINYSVYFTNHLQEVIKIDSNIVENSSIITQTNKLYSSFVFTTNGIYYKPDIVGDLQNRIKVRYKIDTENEVNLYFVIDYVEYLDDGNIRVYCKSDGIKYTSKYGSLLNGVISANSLSSLLSNIIPNADINITDCNLIFDYTVKNKSAEEVINDLHNIFYFDYYVANNTIYFRDKRTIQDETPIKTFNSIEDILTISTTTDTSNKNIGFVNINIKKIDDIYSTPKMNLQIKDTPQCCSPDNVEIYTATDGTVYRINPVNAYWILYYSPLTEIPNCNIAYQSGEREVIEHFELKDDDFVELVGGIDTIVAISGVTNPTYIQNYNVLAFDKVTEGSLDITYKTKVLHGTITHSSTPKEIRFSITHYNQQIDYIHKIQFDGYYPIPYNLKINLMKDWGLDYDNSINKTIAVGKFDGESFVSYGNYTSDSFGNFTLPLNEYNHFLLSTDGAKDLHLDYFANDMKFFMSDKSNG